MGCLFFWGLFGWCIFFVEVGRLLTQNIDLFDVWWIFSATIWICNWRVFGCAPEKNGPFPKERLVFQAAFFTGWGGQPPLTNGNARGTPSWGCGLMSLQISWCFYHVGCSAWFLWFTWLQLRFDGLSTPSLHSDASFSASHHGWWLPTSTWGLPLKLTGPRRDYPVDAVVTNWALVGKNGWKLEISERQP